MLAARAHRGWPGWKVFVLLPTALFLARACLLAYGHLLHRKLELNHPGFSSQVVVGRGVSVGEAWTLVVLSAAGVLFCCALLNPLCLYCALPALALGCAYYHIRLKSDFGSLFLGGVFAMAPLGGWMAVTGSVSWEPLALGVINILWISGLDTLYSVKNYEIEKALGLRSLPIRWGVQNALSYSLLMHLLTVMAMAVFGFLVMFKIAYMVAVMFIAAIVIIEHWIAKIRKKHWIGNAFSRLNILVNIVYLLASACEIIFPFFNFSVK